MKDFCNGLDVLVFSLSPCITFWYGEILKLIKGKTFFFFRKNVERVNLCMSSTMQFGSSGNICDMRLGGNRFESRPQRYLNSNILSFCWSCRQMLE
jgi:hypothetical protein